MIPARRAFRMFAALLMVAAFALPFGAHEATAQSYPDRPIKIIVPIGPAGSYDIVGRLLADQLAKRLGQTVVVENRPGAGTIVGTQAAISAPADGYTLLVGGLSNIVFNAGLFKNLPYDPLNDLVPVALVFNISYTLVGAKELPYSTPKDVIEAAKKSPGKITLANAGLGTGQHILGAAFAKITGTQFLEVPYRSSSAAYPDLLSGRVDLFVEFDTRSAALHQVGPGQGPGHPRRQAQPAGAGRADHDRGRRAGPRDQFLDRSVRAGENAAGGDRSPAARDRAVPAGAQAALRHRRRRAHGRAAGSAQINDQSRLRQVDEDHQRCRHPIGLNAHTAFGAVAVGTPAARRGLRHQLRTRSRATTQRPAPSTSQPGSIMSKSKSSAVSNTRNGETP